ncbi:HAD-like domain-containing protein [Morchella snyderi]|nr:HAD-like domain-containing protein [Morchella snyderi]
MLARALTRSLLASRQSMAALPRRCPAALARNSPLLMAPLHRQLQQQSRAYSLKKRRPYTGGDPSKDVDPADADPNADPIIPAEANASPLSQDEAAAAAATAAASPSSIPSPDADPTPDPDPTAKKTSTGGGKGDEPFPKPSYVSSTDRKRERLARLVFAAFLAGLVGGAIYLGQDLSEFEQTIYDTAAVPNGWTPGAFYARVKARVQNVLDFYNEPPFEKLLPDPHPDYSRPYTLVIALEDLCVHSAWDREHGWRIAKRPGLDYFLAYLFNYYEIVVFASQHDQIAAPVIQKMDQYPGYIMYPLFRSHTRYKDGKYIKDLNYLNRDLSKVIMLETNPDAWAMNPNNTVKMKPWTGDARDTELVKLIPFLEYIAAMGISDVRPVIEDFGDKDVAAEFARREALARVELKKRVERERAQRKGSLGEVLMAALGMAQPRKRREDEEKTFMDLARERGQQMYEETQKHIAEHRDEMMKEQKNMEREAAEQMKTSLSKIFTEGLPKPPGQA